MKAAITVGGLLVASLALALALKSGLVAAAPAAPEAASAMPEYQPQGGPHRQFGEIRSWGNENMLNVLRLWQLGFRKHQRAVHFVDTLPSGAVAVGALYTGVADLGLVGHRIWPIERQAFQRVKGYEITEVRVATGSYDVPAFMPGSVVYVHKDNPLAQLTVAQLDGIFGAARTGGWVGKDWTTASARGPEQDIRTWGQLGIGGEWADKPIHVYGFDLTGTGFSISLQQKAFEGGDTWNPTLVEAPLGEPAVIGEKSTLTGGDRIVDMLAHDRYGMAYAGVMHGARRPEVKALPLAVGEGGPFVAPSKASFIDGSYPLAESIYVYIDHAPGTPVDPKLREFLAFILSREGQAEVARSNDYLPLAPAAVREELQKLAALDAAATKKAVP